MNLVRMLPLLIVAALAGCEATPVLEPKTAHGGRLLTLPEKQGAVEVVKQEVEGPTSQVRVLAYFYGPDTKPLAKPPTTATFTPMGRDAKPVDLKPGAESDGGLASAPFASDGDLAGELIATVDGKPIKLAVQLR